VAAGVATDEPRDPAVGVADRDDEPVPEGVDERAAPRGLGQVEGDQFIVSDAVLAQVASTPVRKSSPFPPPGRLDMA
jgi:hypothetical protein